MGGIYQFGKDAGDFATVERLTCHGGTGFEIRGRGRE